MPIFLLIKGGHGFYREMSRPLYGSAIEKGIFSQQKQPESKAEAATITYGFASPSNYIFNKRHGLKAL